MTCSDETRFQGIATIVSQLIEEAPRQDPCSDETRFQGIATNFWRGMITHPRGALAVTRPVFRGLRPRLTAPLPDRRRGTRLQ
mgnify:CR=1 FL=1